MLTIGYVRQGDAMEPGEIAGLEAAGCQVVRTEVSAAGGDVLASILDFISHGDQLVVSRLDRLASSGRGLFEVLSRLEARGARLRVLAPEIDSHAASGHTLRAVLKAVAALEPSDPARSRRVSPVGQDIISLHRAGIGPVEISRRLGVSRMTVWRRLKAKDAIHG